MTVLTSEELKSQYKASESEVEKYFKNHPKLKRNASTTRRVRDRIRASKIVRAPGKEVSFVQSAAEWQIIYGKYEVGGVITFVDTGGSNNQVLHMVITIAGHEINSVLKLYLDDEEVIFGASPDPRWSTGIRRTDGSIAPADHKVFMSPTTGQVGQATNSDLNGQIPSKWTSAHTQDGCAYVYLILVWDASLFPNGVPNITFLVEGKPVKLPDGSTAYTDNAAAIIRDLLTDTRYGVGVPEAQIDEDLYEAAYDYCEEELGVTGANDEKRYTINGVFKASESPREMLEAMCAAMGGTVTYVNGLWKIYPAKYRAPTLTLTQDDILTDIRVQTKFSRKDSFNGVRGTFTSPLDNFEETDFPAVKNDYYMQLDNNERVWEDIQLPLTDSPARCQRLSKIELERNRQAITVQFTASLKAYQLQPEDTVMITNPRFGWDEKIFEVQQCTLTMDGGGSSAPFIAVDLLLRETAEAVFDWAEGSETAYDLAPNTELPNPLFVPVIQNLLLESGTDQLFIRGDGTVFSRIKISWSLPDDFFVTSGGVIQVQYKRSDSISWQAVTDIPGDINSTFILDVQDLVAYDVRIRARNAISVTGEWLTQEDYIVIGKTERPSDVQGFSGSIESFGIRFTWTKVPDLDVNSYEIRIGAVGAVWETSTFLTIVSGTTHSANIRLADNYQFLIKAVDTTGNYSEHAATLLAAIVGPEAPILSIQLNQEEYVLRWTEPTSLFAIDSYEVAYGEFSTEYADRIFITNTKGLSYQNLARWGGFRKFWVTGIDVAGNYGTPDEISLTIEVPSVVRNFTTQVLDQNVLLRWEEPVRHSLPMSHFLVYKGNDIATAQLVGENPGTFAPLFEILGGTYTYWIRGVDSGGNLGDPAKTTTIVQPPSDFVLIQTGDPQDPSASYIDPGTGDGVRFTDDSNRLIMPVNEIETWDQHFENNSLTTTADGVAAGLSYLLQPVPLAAFWSRVLDYGGIIDAALIVFEFSREDYDGTPTLLTFISYSEDGTVWTTTQGQQAYAQNFQYVRIAIQIGAFGSSGESMGLPGMTYP